MIQKAKQIPSRKSWAKWIRSQADEQAVAEGCWFDINAADRVRSFFTKFVRHSTGQWAGQPFDLLDWQWNDFIAPLYGWRRADGTRRYRRGFVQIAKKNGKALAIDTPIPTPNGWSMMGDLQPGDQVFDENGLPCEVTAITEVQHDRPCYRVKFSDGCEIVADAEHEWVTHARKTLGTHGLRGSGHVMIRTTRQIAECVRVDYQGSEGWNHSIPCSESLQLPPADLPVDPYVLGAWLGDGNSASARLTCGYEDLQIVDNIIACGVSCEERRSSNARSGCFQLGSGGRSQSARNESLQKKLRLLGVLKNKHIPAAYLRGSHSQRMSLLQGLMDTDGCASKSGQLEFTTINPRLRDDFMELARTLGFKPQLKTARATIYGKDCGEKYRIQFWAFADNPVFRLGRKAARQKQRPSRKVRSANRHIVAVDAIDSVPVKCIEVNSPSHLYLAGTSMIPTHNSAIASGLTLYHLTADGEASAEVLCAACDRIQAGIVFDEAAKMVESSPALTNRLEVVRSSKRIVYWANGSVFRALSADAHRNEGLRPSCVIVDELHAQPNRRLWDSLRWGGAARREPLMLAITTAGWDRTSICYEEYQYAKSIIEGRTFDSSYFGYIAEAGESDDWTDEAVWHKANPSLGHTITLDSFRDDFKQAFQSTASQNAFKRYRLNIWTEQDVRWLDQTKWAACAEAYDESTLEGQTCYAGLDMAATQDVCAFVLLFPCGDGKHRVLPYFWVPGEANKKRERNNRTRLDPWTSTGIIRVHEGDEIDFDRVRDDICELGKRFHIAKIAKDSWNSKHIGQQLMGDGFSVVDFGQGIGSMSAPSKEFERRISAGEFRHNDNPVLNWMAGNVSVFQDGAGNIRPLKEKSSDKIDGIVSAIMATGLSMTETIDAGETIWL